MYLKVKELFHGGYSMAMGTQDYERIDQFIVIVASKGYSSTAGRYWHRFFKIIRAQAKHGKDDEIKNPLILAGSIASDDDKRERFQSHLLWAAERGSLEAGLGYLKKIMEDPEKWNNRAEQVVT